MVVISVYTYSVKIIKKFRWESGFLGGFNGTPPPLCTNGSAGYLMQLSVNIIQCQCKLLFFFKFLVHLVFVFREGKKQVNWVDIYPVGNTHLVNYPAHPANQTCPLPKITHPVNQTLPTEKIGTTMYD